MTNTIRDSTMIWATVVDHLTLNFFGAPFDGKCRQCRKFLSEIMIIACFFRVNKYVPAPWMGQFGSKPNSWSAKTCIFNHFHGGLGYIFWQLSQVLKAYRNHILICKRLQKLIIEFLGTKMFIPNNWKIDGKSMNIWLVSTYSYIFSINQITRITIKSPSVQSNRFHPTPWDRPSDPRRGRSRRRCGPPGCSITTPETMEILGQMSSWSTCFWSNMLACLGKKNCKKGWSF